MTSATGSSSEMGLGTGCRTLVGLSNVTGMGKEKLWVGGKTTAARTDNFQSHTYSGRVALGEGQYEQ